MAVVIETTIGDFTVDLYVDRRPQACKNFLKLCKVKYYNFCLFHSVQPNFLAQTGDPSGEGSGGESIYGYIHGENTRYFEAEVTPPKLKHFKPGLLSMVNCGNNMLGSQFFITLGEDLVSLDGEHCVFGEISEGTEIIHKLNETICDSLHRPYKDIRIAHTVVLEDPFEDPLGLKVPDHSPEPTAEKLANGRIGADEEIDDTAGLTATEVEELKQEREAKARATILEIVGDLPDADVAPPENVLFVCKLNPVTTDQDLEIIFNRFGKVKSCEIIRDKTTGDSLQYAFVEFEDQKACENAYFKMDNVLIDDRRIHVDFSQSTAKERKIRWRGKGKGVEHLESEEKPSDNKSSYKDKDDSRNRSKSRSRRDRDYEERDYRKERTKERVDEKQSKVERGKEKDSDERERRRRERDYSRGRSDYQKRDSKRVRGSHKEDDKKYDKRRNAENSHKKDSDTKRLSSSSCSSRRRTERRSEERKLDEQRKEKVKRDVNGRSSSHHNEFDKSGSSEKFDTRQHVEKLEGKEEHTKHNSPSLNYKEDNSNCSIVNDRDLLRGNESKDNILNKVVDQIKVDINTDEKSPKNTADSKRLIEGEEIKKEELESDTTEDKAGYKSNKKSEEPNKIGTKKKASKRKHKMPEIKKKKKRYHSSSSDSSSESSDSSDSSSSSDSSDYRHSRDKKLVIAKKYYRGGKLVKEVKKKKRIKDTSDSDSVSDESSDSDSKRKRKSRKQKKGVNLIKQSKKPNSSNDSPSETSSSENSDIRNKKYKRKSSGKKSKSKQSSKKKKKIKETSSSSDSESSVRNKQIHKT